MPIIPREQVAEQLAVDSTLLIRYESRGLVQVAREGAVEGYRPGEVRRVWSIVSLHRDLGINLAGVEAILRLRSTLDQLQRRLRDLASELDEVSRPPDEAEHD
jgi:MerR family transcriptional regulator/heat shock protein HspR